MIDWKNQDCGNDKWRQNGYDGWWTENRLNTPMIAQITIVWNTIGFYSSNIDVGFSNLEVHAAAACLQSTKVSYESDKENEIQVQIVL